MSIKKEESGRRSIQVEVEVPGTPEEVWEAIATGRGVSSWFVPCQGDERVGGTVTTHFGPGMDSTATVTRWDPPYRFAAESNDLGPNAPTMATEWIVEARSGSTCVVRVVHSLFASSDDWDDQLNGFESGWPSFFRILRLYILHFRGQPCSTFRLLGVSTAPESQAWKTLTDALGLSRATPDRCWTATAAAPLGGVIEWASEPATMPALLLRLDQPAPGIAFLNACTSCGQVYLTIGFYLYGEQATGMVARDEPLWQAWMNERFPLALEASPVTANPATDGTAANLG